MTSAEFVATLDEANQSVLRRLEPDATLKPEVSGALNVTNLLKVALKNEIEATEIAARWLVGTTNGWDYEAIFAALAPVPGIPVLGYTTHALAHSTQPLHARCRRVVTKETLTQELPALLQRGLAA